MKHRMLMDGNVFGATRMLKLNKVIHETVKLTTEETEMKSIILSSLIMCVKWLVANANWELIKSTVQDLNNEDLSGTEKKELVMRALDSVVKSLGVNLVNLAIEVAVLSIKQTTKEVPPGLHLP
jgi:hypothetical protein